MKYLYYILAITICSSVFFAYFLFGGKQTSVDEPVLIVNDRTISKKEYGQPVADRMDKSETEGDYLESVITRELLIQEAKRQGIDKEEKFRQSIQSFYEQSLVKILMDRQYEKLKVDLSNKEIEEYRTWLKSGVTFTLLYYKSRTDQENNKTFKEEVLSGPYGEFSEPIRQQLFGLKPGEKRFLGQTGEVYQYIRLDKMEELPKVDLQQTATSQLKTELVELKKEQMINQWLQQLREQAKIVVLGSK